MSTVRVDVHQHLWPEPLLAALADRSDAPCLRPEGADLVLRLAGEPDCVVRRDEHHPERRFEQDGADGIDRALVCLSHPLGIECLAPDEAGPLLDAYHEGVLALPDHFGAWAAAGLVNVSGPGLAARLDDGFVGLSLPAAALGGPEGFRRCAPLLAELERRGRPLLIHPGPAPWVQQAVTEPGGPTWWPAMTDYVAQMNAAWHAFPLYGRPAYPTLRVVFAMLAGGGPFQAERLQARSGRPGGIDSDVFLDISSYGPRAIDAALRCVGVDQLVYGSDRPVVAAPIVPFGPAVAEALLVRNPSRLLSPIPVEAHA